MFRRCEDVDIRTPLRRGQQSRIHYECNKDDESVMKSKRESGDATELSVWNMPLRMVAAIFCGVRVPISCA